MNTAVVLPVERRLHVARYAKGALVVAGAVGHVPTPLDDVAAALKLHPAEDLYDLADAPPAMKQRLSRLKHKIKGVLDVGSRTIYIDRDQLPGQQRFTYGHEIGHGAVPWHKDAYYGDDCSTLDPFTRDELEAEASAFSAELLYNLDEFSVRAHSGRLSLATALDLAEQFGASRHSGIRRYVEDAPRPCALLVIGRYLIHPSAQISLKVLYSVESVHFRERFGPISTCIPEVLPISEYPLAHDAHAVLFRRTSEPVTAGSMTLTDTRRGSTVMNYEVYSNTYRAFALLFPRPRLDLRRPVRAEWAR
jgi:IrrE N-terminal-like domain